MHRKVAKLGGFSLVGRPAYIVFLSLDFHLFVLDVEPHPVVNAHVLVGSPDQGKERDQVSAPVCKEQMVARDCEHRSGDVMTEAIFAREHIEDFPSEHRPRAVSLSKAILARLAKDFFMGNRPGDAGDWNGKHQQPDNLHTQAHDCLSRTNLSVVQEAHNDGPAADVARGGGKQPVEVGVRGDFSVHYRCENLATACDAVGEPA